MAHIVVPAVLVLASGASAYSAYGNSQEDKTHAYAEATVTRVDACTPDGKHCVVDATITVDSQPVALDGVLYSKELGLPRGEPVAGKTKFHVRYLKAHPAGTALLVRAPSVMEKPIFGIAAAIILALAAISVVLANSKSARSGMYAIGAGGAARARQAGAAGARQASRVARGARGQYAPASQGDGGMFW
jgi:hypothetical protein